MARKSKSIRVYVRDWLHFWVMFWYIQFHCLLGEEFTMSHRGELVAKMPEIRAGLVFVSLLARLRLLAL